MQAQAVESSGCAGEIPLLSRRFGLCVIFAG